MGWVRAIAIILCVIGAEVLMLKFMVIPGLQSGGSHVADQSK